MQLLPILQRVFPDTISYQVEHHIVQSSAEGFLVTTSSANANEDDKELFVKCVDASKYSCRSWADLRRALLYSRTEARFYSDILPLLRKESSSWDIAPICYLAESKLENLIGEEESTSASAKSTSTSILRNDFCKEPKYDINDNSVLKHKGGNLVIQSLKRNYYQTSPLTFSQASLCLSALAKFHSTAFENEEVLQMVSTSLCEYGGSYHLKNRNPKELDQICDTWDAFVENIQEAAPADFFERENIRNIGQRIYNVATYVSDELSPSYQEEFATVVHGDYKAMNVFLPDNIDGVPLLIDFASTGVGIGMSDVAMHITHAIHPKYLENGGEMRLIEVYLEELNHALPSSFKSRYTLDQAMRHYGLATVDYFRFILGRMWRGSTIQMFKERENLTNFAEINRTVDAALAFIERVEKYLVEIEKEVKSKKLP